MQTKLPCKRYCVQDYGGRLFTEIQRTTTKDVLCVKRYVNLIERMRCP
jgi:hypothetical protein